MLFVFFLTVAFLVQQYQFGLVLFPQSMWSNFSSVMTLTNMVCLTILNGWNQTNIKKLFHLSLACVSNTKKHAWIVAFFLITSLCMVDPDTWITCIFMYIIIDALPLQISASSSWLCLLETCIDIFSSTDFLGLVSFSLECCWNDVLTVHLLFSIN